MPAEQRYRSESAAIDLVNSLKIYRSLAVSPPTTFPADRYVSVPVQLIVGAKDPVVRPHGFDDLSRWVPRLWRRDINAGHWSPMSHPQVLAAGVAELVDFLEGKPASRSLLRAQVGRTRDDFGDTLVSVTGAGSGIGRETALALRVQAPSWSSATSTRRPSRKPPPRSSSAAVSRTRTWSMWPTPKPSRGSPTRCAPSTGCPTSWSTTRASGRRGSSSKTPADQWDRVLDVNLGGVVNGCRAFGKRLVDRGTGGHVVNVTSMAAYAPAKLLNAYCTSKAAAYMFSDCLRAEFDVAGIGLTTVCPGVIDTNIVHTTRFDIPERTNDKLESRREDIEKMFGRRRYGPDKVAKAITRRRQEEQAGAARGPGGLSAVRHIAFGAAGPSQHSALEARLTRRPSRQFSRSCSDVLEHREHGAGRHPGAALAGVTPRAAGVVGRGGDIDVRPRHAVGHELA